MATTRWNENLRQLRLARGWKQIEAARRLGLRPNRYNQYENGRRLPPVDVAVRIADLYGVSLNELFHASKCHEEKHDYQTGTPGSEPLDTGEEGRSCR